MREANVYNKRSKYKKNELGHAIYNEKKYREKYIFTDKWIYY